MKPFKKQELKHLKFKLIEEEGLTEKEANDRLKKLCLEVVKNHNKKKEENKLKKKEAKAMFKLPNDY